MPPAVFEDSGSSKATHPLRRRIAVFAGPTGGHLFPAQSFGEGFRKRFPDSIIGLVTSHRAKNLTSQMPEGIFNHIEYLPDFGFPVRVSWATLKPFLLAPYLFWKSFKYLIKTRPEVCVGFASFASYPGMMMAHWLGIPTLIHEQNLTPGKATQWLAPHMDLVAESFPKTRFASALKKVCTVGLPLRASILSAKFERDPVSVKALRPLTLLVVGGSQGALGLNVAILNVWEQFSLEERAQIAVIHITGKQDWEHVLACYQKLGIKHEVYPFHAAMQELFRKVDLAVSRAGANTLFELAFFGIPALVVPYPHAGGHQKYNAQSFSECGGLLYHEENEEVTGWLRDHLRGVMAAPSKLADMARSMAALGRPRATDDLIELAQGLMRRNEDH